MVAVALLSTAVVSCGEEEKGTTSAEAVIPKDAPDTESWNTTLILTDSTWTRAKMEIGHARQYVAKMETLLDSGVYVRFYDRDGALNATLVADSARIDDRTRDMAAFGRVHVHSGRTRRVIDTERLYFDNERRLLHSDAPVLIVDSARGQTVNGVGFESDEGLTRYKIYRVTATRNQ